LSVHFNSHCLRTEALAWTAKRQCPESKTEITQGNIEEPGTIVIYGVRETPNHENGPLHIHLP